jgi:hypothetical protein
MVHINGKNVTFDAFRDAHDGVYDYDDIIHSGTLKDSTVSVSVSFQDGVSPESGYSGTRDTVLSQNSPNTNFGGDAALYVDGDDPSGSGNDLSTLLYWDVSAITAGSILKEANITLNVFNASNNTYQVYEMKQNWVENESTWNQYSSVQGWEIPGAFGSQDRGAAVLGSFSTGGTGAYVINLNSEGIALVQSWVDNPLSNHGLIIADASATDGVDFDSREASAVAGRPKLTVRYAEEQLSNIKAAPWIPLLLLH